MDSSLTTKLFSSGLLVVVLSSMVTAAALSVVAGEAGSWTPRGVGRADNGEFVNEADGSVLVLVRGPRTAYTTLDSRHPWYHVPRRRVDYAFLIGKYEVSRAQYAAFCAATARAEPDDVEASPPDWPVVGLQWDEMEAYCRWASVRLPTVAEWEYAAVGAEGRAFPWGEEPPSGSRINSRDRSSGLERADPWDDGFPTLAPVHAFPASASWAGALQMLGNAAEAVLAYPTLYEQSEPEDRYVYGGSAWDRASRQHWMWSLRRFEAPSEAVGFRICRRYADGPY